MPQSNTSERTPAYAHKKVVFRWRPPFSPTTLPPLSSPLYRLDQVTNTMKYPNFIGEAHHGSGKTGAFTLAMLQRINADDPRLQALVICHSRDLAIQNVEVCKSLGQNMNGLSTYLAIPQGIYKQTKKKHHPFFISCESANATGPKLRRVHCFFSKLVRGLMKLRSLLCPVCGKHVPKSVTPFFHFLLPTQDNNKNDQQATNSLINGINKSSSALPEPY